MVFAKRGGVGLVGGERRALQAWGSRSFVYKCIGKLPESAGKCGVMVGGH